MPLETWRMHEIEVGARKLPTNVIRLYQAVEIDAAAVADSEWPVFYNMLDRLPNTANTTNEQTIKGRWKLHLLDLSDPTFEKGLGSFRELQTDAVHQGSGSMVYNAASDMFDELCKPTLTDMCRSCRPKPVGGITQIEGRPDRGLAATSNLEVGSVVEGPGCCCLHTRQPKRNISSASSTFSRKIRSTSGKYPA